MFDSVVSALPSGPMTDAEFEVAQRMSDQEYPVEDVVAWMKTQDRALD
jgi:hypothetical protein